jgi:SpoVK/Ycf46/Vps4 family AAA+-type ATPase
LSEIEEQYVVRRQTPDKADSAPQSMLLYGPPGTGKTTLAEQIAARLSRPLIVVTVSDFLAAGGAEIENRAKGVFEVLKAQEDVVVLFDEIDQFLLDRNSELYKDQDDVFKFMTPGMLTKLQDLRDAENSIFIIATNYYERIDSAIRRPGRIDRHFLLSVPDRAQRLELLVRFVSEHVNAAVDVAALRKSLEVSQVLQLTALFGYGDLLNLVRLRSTLDSAMDTDGIAGALANAAKTLDPAASLTAYRSRFEGNNQYPYEEFFLLLYLANESGKALSTSDRDAVHAALSQVHGLDGETTFEALKQRGYVEDQTLFDALSAHKTELLSGWRRPGQPK